MNVSCAGHENFQLCVKILDFDRLTEFDSLYSLDRRTKEDERRTENIANFLCSVHVTHDPIAQCQ